MPKSSLIDAFEVKSNPLKIKNISDYQIFTDKELLDNLRNNILENLIDENIPEDKLLETFINDEIDKLRHSATASLFESRDTIVVASVSCIYGLR